MSSSTLKRPLLQLSCLVKRKLSSSCSSFGSKVNLKPAEDGMYLQLEDTSKALPLLLHSTWLRDHCRCPSCYDRLTRHKMVEVKHGIQPQQVKIQDQQLCITWPDGHQSNYNLDWLWANTYEEYREARKGRKKLWDAGVVGFQVAEQSVNFEDFVHSQEAVKQALTLLFHYGFAVINNGPANAEAALQVAERVGQLRLGFFGEVMTFGSNMLHHHHSQTADKLILHTDQAYLTEPAGVKVVNCLQTGGSACLSLVDGFSAAAQLKKTDPSAYNTLTEVPVPFEFKMDAASHKTIATIFQHDIFTKELLLVRYNMYYRSALLPKQYQDMDQFYSALHAYSKLLQQHLRAVRLTPKRGTIYLIDNWRLLTSMNQFKEKGVQMAGCYVSYTDYMSTARSLGAIKPTQ